MTIVTSSDWAHLETSERLPEMGPAPLVSQHKSLLVEANPGENVEVPVSSDRLLTVIRNDAGDEIELRSPSGEVELRITVTDSGPVLRLRERAWRWTPSRTSTSPASGSPSIRARKHN